jgi:hypothetical protein
MISFVESLKIKNYNNLLKPKIKTFEGWMYGFHGFHEIFTDFDLKNS